MDVKFLDGSDFFISESEPNFSFPFPFPLEVGPLIAAKGSGGALKLPQRVRAGRGSAAEDVSCIIGEVQGGQMT